jgi:hypothetical protein
MSSTCLSEALNLCAGQNDQGAAPANRKGERKEKTRSVGMTDQNNNPSPMPVRDQISSKILTSIRRRAVTGAQASYLKEPVSPGVRLHAQRTGSLQKLTTKQECHGVSPVKTPRTAPIRKTSARHMEFLQSRTVEQSDVATGVALLDKEAGLRRFPGSRAQAPSPSQGGDIMLLGHDLLNR